MREYIHTNAKQLKSSSSKNPQNYCKPDLICIISLYSRPCSTQQHSFEIMNFKLKQYDLLQLLFPLFLCNQSKTAMYSNIHIVMKKKNIHVTGKLNVQSL